MTGKYSQVSISEQLREELLLEDEDIARITFVEDLESLCVYVDGLLSGYADKTINTACWELDTLVYGAKHQVQGHAEAISRTFEDFESLDTNQRIRASILKDSTAFDLHSLIMDWLEEGFSRDDRFYPLVVADNEDPRDLLLDLLRTWGKRWFLKK